MTEIVNLLVLGTAAVWLVIEGWAILTGRNTISQEVWIWVRNHPKLRWAVFSGLLYLLIHLLIPF